MVKDRRSGIEKQFVKTLLVYLRQISFEIKILLSNRVTSKFLILSEF